MMMMMMMMMMMTSEAASAQPLLRAPAAPEAHRRPVPRMAASSEAPPPQPLSLTGLPAVEDYISEHHVDHISWHITLNNHSSTRPKGRGGRLFPSVTECKTFEQPRGGAPWRCSLTLPNSFAPGDGRVLHTVGEGRTKDEASEHACRQAMAQLLLADASQVVLRETHWKVSPEALVQGLPLAPGTRHQALPVHVPARVREAGAEAASLSEDEVRERVTKIITDCLRAHGGTFDPAWISHKKWASRQATSASTSA